MTCVSISSWGELMDIIRDTNMKRESKMPMAVESKSVKGKKMMDEKASKKSGSMKEDKKVVKEEVRKGKKYDK